MTESLNPYISPKEKLWVNFYQEAVNAPENTSHLPLGVFIDDDRGLAQGWETCFRIPKFATLTPEIPNLRAETRVDITQKIIQFTNALTNNQLERLSVVVVDQFFDNWDLRVELRKFISKLRGINKEAWVLETSGLAYDKVYPESNVVLENGRSANDVMSLILRLPASPAVRIQAIKTYHYPAFVEAGLADPTYQSYFNRLEKESGRQNSFSLLSSRDEFQILKAYLGIPDITTLFSAFSSMSPLDQKLFLHFSWNIVGHMSMGNDEGRYSGPLTRLKQLLLERKS